MSARLRIYIHHCVSHFLAPSFSHKCMMNRTILLTSPNQGVSGPSTKKEMNFTSVQLCVLLVKILWLAAENEQDIQFEFTAYVGMFFFCLFVLFFSGGWQNVPLVCVVWDLMRRVCFHERYLLPVVHSKIKLEGKASMLMQMFSGWKVYRIFQHQLFSRTLTPNWGVKSRCHTTLLHINQKEEQRSTVRSESFEACCSATHAWGRWHVGGCLWKWHCWGLGGKCVLEAWDAIHGSDSVQWDTNHKCILNSFANERKFWHRKVTAKNKNTNYLATWTFVKPCVECSWVPSGWTPRTHETFVMATLRAKTDRKQSVWEFLQCKFYGFK